MMPAVLTDRRRCADLERRLQRTFIDHTDLATAQVLTGVSHAVHVAGFPVPTVALWLRMLADDLEARAPVMPVLVWLSDEGADDARHA